MHMYERWLKNELNCASNDLSIEMSKIIKETAKILCRNKKSVIGITDKT